MYSTLKNVQSTIAMLKERGIRNCVISPGNSHNAIVRSMENDNFFVTYNIVDERSAAFFAIGLIQELNEPVAVCCTAGTAVSNLLSGVTEAYRRNLPLVVITADKNPYYLNQYEDQMIEQKNIFKDVIKYSVTLPIVRDQKDEWYCNRLLNEAFLEMNHHGTGPIHINVPIEEGMFAIGKYFTAKELPKINVIKRIDGYSTSEKWKEKFDSLRGKKVMIIYGQDYHVPSETVELVESIFNKYNCIFAVDKLSNLKGRGTLEISRAALYNKFRNNNDLKPDIVISLAGNTVLDYKYRLKDIKLSFEHWIVNEEGRVADPFKKLTTVFECTTLEFLRKMDQFGSEVHDHSYYEAWREENEKFVIPKFEFSNLYAVQKLMEKIPENSLLNLANSTTIRIAQYFDLSDSVKVYCNRGVNGIDGCMSTFIGQSAVTDKLSFLIIGDLAFFYDMNALWNRYVGKNVRIMLNNNAGSSLFHFNQGLKNFPTLNQNVAAEHFTTAKGWVEDLGFKYLSANNKVEFDEALKEFVSPNSDRPIIFEVFTKKEEDARLQHEFYNLNRAPLEGKEAFKASLKKTIKSVIGEEIINKIRTR